MKLKYDKIHLKKSKSYRRLARKFLFKQKVFLVYHPYNVTCMDETMQQKNARSTLFIRFVVNAKKEDFLFELFWARSVDSFKKTESLFNQFSFLYRHMFTNSVFMYIEMQKLYVLCFRAIEQKPKVQWYKSNYIGMFGARLSEFMYYEDGNKVWPDKERLLMHNLIPELVSTYQYLSEIVKETEFPLKMCQIQ